MWYKIAQENTEERKPGWQVEMEWKSGLSKYRELQNKIESSLEKLDPQIAKQYKQEYENIINLNSQNQNIYNFQPLQKIYDGINDQVKMQEIQAQDYIKSIVENKSSITQDYDADKLFKDYLLYQNIENMIGFIGTGDDLTQIAKFFLQNATNPKFAKVKLILSKIPQSKWGIEITTLLLCFYLNIKLEQLINVLKNKNPMTFKNEVAISLLESKMAVNSMKIGVSLNSILNKNLFGQLLGQVSGVALQGVEGLQNMMNTDKKIQETLRGN